MPVHKVNESGLIPQYPTNIQPPSNVPQQIASPPTNDAEPVTWDKLAKVFLYLNLMWDDEVKPSRLFGLLSEACGEIAAGK